jgi:outer membrane protein assembly factor BamB
MSQFYAFRDMSFSYQSFFYRRLLALLLACTVIAACSNKSAKPAATVRAPAWQKQFEHPIEFHTLADQDLLVVGTTRHLYGIEPRSGRQLWRERNIHAASRDIMGMGEMPYLLVNDAAGGTFDDAGTHVLLLDRSDGSIFWESAALTGKVLQGTIDSAAGRVFATTVESAHGDDRGMLSGALPNKGLRSGLRREPTISAFDVASGQVLWSRPLGTKVQMKPSHRPTLAADAEWRHVRPFDLDLYHPPFIAGALICTTYTGISCFDTQTGEPVWQHEFRVIDDKLSRSYPNPIVDAGVVIVGSAHRIRAFELESGKRVWRSARFDSVPELVYDDTRLYGQLGGNYFNIAKEKWVWEGDFGALAIDKRTGTTLWRYDDANDSVTNLLVLNDRVWLADEKRLIALDRESGDVRMRVRHRLEKKPLYAALNQRGRIILISENEVSAYDPVGGQRLWHTSHPIVGPGPWRKFSARLLHASGTVLKVGSFVLASGAVPGIPSLVLPVGGGVKLLKPEKVIARQGQRMGRQITQASSLSEDVGYANLQGGHQYFVTQSKGSKEVMLAGVNLETGVTDLMIPMRSDHPNIVIDESNTSIYQAFGDQLVATHLGE